MKVLHSNDITKKRGDCGAESGSAQSHNAHNGVGSIFHKIVTDHTVMDYSLPGPTKDSDCAWLSRLMRLQKLRWLDCEMDHLDPNRDCRSWIVQSAGNQREHQYTFGHVYHVDVFDFCSKLSQYSTPLTTLTNINLVRDLVIFILDLI